MFTHTIYRASSVGSTWVRLSAPFGPWGWCVVFGLFGTFSGTDSNALAAPQISLISSEETATEPSIAGGQVGNGLRGLRQGSVDTPGPDDESPRIEPIATGMDSATNALEAWVQQGIAVSPVVWEARAKVEAIQHRIPQALALPDPMLTTNAFAAPIQTAAGEQRFSLGISQTFVNRDRRSTRAAILQAELQEAQAAVLAAEIQVASQLRSAAYQWLMTVRTSDVLVQQQTLLRQWLNIIVQNYETTPSMSQGDILSVQIKQAELQSQLVGVQQRERIARGRINRLLRRHVDEPLTDEVQFPQLESVELALDQWIETARRQRPELAGQLATLEARRKKVDLASLQQTPDFTVGLNWIAISETGISPVANGDDAFGISIGLNLPMSRRRIEGGIFEAKAELNAASYRYEGLSDEIAEDVLIQVSKLESTRETLRLLQTDVIPKAKQSLENALEDYSVGRIRYSELQEVWQTSLRYQINEINLQAQVGESLASLAAAVGQIHCELQP